MLKYFRRLKQSSSENKTTDNPRLDKKQKKVETQNIHSTCANQNEDKNNTEEGENFELTQANIENSNVHIELKKENFSCVKITDTDIICNNAPKNLIENENVSNYQSNNNDKYNHIIIKPVSFNPINKSRKFFGEIMAKGRHRQRNRNKYPKEKIETISSKPQENNTKSNFQCNKNNNNDIINISNNNNSCQLNQVTNKNNINPNNGNTLDDNEFICAGATNFNLIKNSIFDENFCIKEYKKRDPVNSYNGIHENPAFKSMNSIVNDQSDDNIINENIKLYQLIDDNDDKLSELTECDRDSYFKFDMGQENSKINIEKKCESNSDHFIVPAITIADYSGNTNCLKTNNDSEIFYDTSNIDRTQNVSVNNDNYSLTINDSYNNNDEIDNEDDEWHFVANNDVNNYLEPKSIRLNDHNNDKNTQIFILNNDKQQDSIDSGIESVVQNYLIENNNNDDTDQFYQINNINNCERELFLRDSSTDCDENILQNDLDDESDLDNINHNNIIDSLSLPDVVVESKGMGNNNSSTNQLDDINDDKPSIVIITETNECEKNNLVNQEARFSAQLEEAQKLIYNAQTKISDLQTKSDDLEKELSIKIWNVDRLQAELIAAEKEDECLRKRLKILEEEIVSMRQKFCETEENLSMKYGDLENEYKELQEKYEKLENLVSTLQTQLAFAESNLEKLKEDKERLLNEKDIEINSLQEKLKKIDEQQKELEEKWQQQFELLRTQHADHEEHLLADCEWQLSNMQKNCKEKIEIALKAKNEVLEKSAEIKKEAQEKFDEVKHLKSYEAEVKQLRGLTSDQRQSLLTMTNQYEELRFDLEQANSELEEQISNVQKLRLKYDIALNDKDRQMIQQIEESRCEVATQWQERLLEEMTRLKIELESVHIEEKNKSIAKLENEHLDEIRQLTSRYETNEDVLRNEIKELHSILLRKSKEFEDLQTKTDSALVQTRMHLERADLEYQIAMNREEEKREKLTKNLRDEFEREKSEMEEKFRERLCHVKDEFSKELTNTTEDLAIEHRKQLEQQWEQLIAEKEEALHDMESRQRIRLEEAENRIKTLEIQHQRNIKDLKNNYEIEITALETREVNNHHEIETLHRKCRCLTNLFEEMRMRYERRDPRPEDLREISELRSKCEANERDLYTLTERLREIQMEQQKSSTVTTRKTKNGRKNSSKAIPLSCDVIYEENEERESPTIEYKEDNAEELTTVQQFLEQSITIDN